LGGTSLYAALLAAVDRAIIPEVPFNMERLAGFLADDREGNPSHYSMVTISEGAVPEGGDITEGGEADAFGHRKLGGIGLAVSQQIKRITGTNVMFQQLGYVIRSGAPDTLDRMVANSFGILAADEVAKGHTGKLVALQGGSYTTVPLTTVAGGQRKIDVAELYDADAYRPKVRDIQGKPMFLY
jgi:6-phosphofructokinase 1